MSPWNSIDAGIPAATCRTSSMRAAAAHVLHVFVQRGRDVGRQTAPMTSLLQNRAAGARKREID